MRVRLVFRLDSELVHGGIRSSGYREFANHPSATVARHLPELYAVKGGKAPPLPSFFLGKIQQVRSLLCSFITYNKNKTTVQGLERPENERRKGTLTESPANFEG
jgi:hypothetical protein